MKISVLKLIILGLAVTLSIKTYSCNVNPGFTYTSTHTCGIPYVVTAVNTSTGTQSQVSKYWWKVNGIMSTDTLIGMDTSIFLLKNLGANSVKLYVKDSSGCIDSSAVSINVSSNAKAIRDQNLNYTHSPVWMNCLQFITDPDSFSIDIESNDTLKQLKVFWGDGTSNLSGTDVLPNIPLTHKFSALGIYTVKIVTTNGSCIDTVYGMVYNQRQPTAGVIGPTSGSNRGCVPHVMKIVNNSYNISNNTTFRVDWGNGDSETLPFTSYNDTLTHLYLRGVCSGVIMITATNVCGSSFTTWNPIDISEKDKARWTVTTTCNPVQDHIFYNVSTDKYCLTPDIKEYFWDFGDGTTVGWINSKTPQYHKYAKEGDYDVMLIAKSACGNDTFIQKVSVFYYPIAKMIYSGGSGCLPVSASYTDTSKGRGLSRLWKVKVGSNLYVFTDSILNYNFTVAGTHSVTLVVTNPCGSDSVVKYIKVTDKPVARFGNITGSCVPFNVSFRNTSVSFYTNPTYLWDFGDGTTSSLANPSSKVYNIPGLYTVSLIVSDSCGSDTFIRQFNAYGLPVAAISGDTSACTFDSLVFKNQSTNSNTFNWSFGDGYNYSNSNNNDVKHLYSAFGNFTVRLIAGTGSGCLDTAFMQVNIKPGAKAQFDINQSFACHPATFKFTNQSIYGKDYQWYANGNLISTGNVPTDTLINTDSTVIRLKLIASSNSSCQSDSIEKVFFTAKYPIASIANVVPGCGPLTVSFNNTSQFNANNSWDLGNGVVSNLLNPSALYPHAINKDSTYNVKLLVRNWLGCKDSTTASVTVYPAPKADFNTASDKGCGPFNAIFTNISQTNNNDPFSSLSHVWSFGDGQSSNSTDPSHLFAPSIFGDSVYYVKLKVSSSNGCIDSITNSIRVYPKPLVKFTPDKVSGCAMLPVQFTNQSSPRDTGSIAIMSFKWISGNGYTSTAKDFSANYNESGFSDTVYNVKLLAWTEHGCVDSASYNITVHPRPHAAFNTNKNDACTPFNVKTINQSYSKDGGALSHDWDFGNLYHSTFSVDSTLYINNTQSDLVKTITYTAISQYGCRDTVAKNITIRPKPIASFTVSNKKLCAPAIITLTDNSSNAFTYFWAEGNNLTSSGTQQKMILNGLKLFDSLYVVRHAVTSSFGCSSDTVYDQILVMGRPDADFMFSKDSACSNENINLINTTLGGYRFTWKFGDNSSNSSLINPKHKFPKLPFNGKDTIFKVTLEVASTSGCKDTTEKSIYLVNKPVNNIVLDKPLGCTNLDVTMFHASKTFKTLYWDFGDNTATVTGDTVMHTYVNPLGNLTMQPKIGLYRQRFNCMDTAYANVMVYPKPIADFKTQRNDPCDAGNYQFINKSKNNASNEWVFDDGTIINVSSFSTLLPSSSTKDTFYNVKLYVKNNYQCIDSNNQVIKVKPKMNIKFEKDQIQSCERGVVNFTNKSSNAVRYFWKFGDGGLSNEVHPSYVYNLYGIYKITLYAYDKDGCVDSTDGKDIFKVLEKPKADFTFLPAMPKLPNATVNFTATPTIVTANVNDLGYDWDFGDGSYPASNYTQKDPTHTYTKAGNVEVTLTVWNKVCSDVVKKPIFIEDPKPEVSFTADTTIGCAPLLVRFTNKTKFARTYRWVWGDGSPDSYEENPMHIFKYSGKWDVTLIATGTGGTNTFSIQYMVTVNPKPDADFFTYKQSMNLPNAVFFIQNMSNNAIKYDWSILDSFQNKIDGSTLRDPSFLINEEGRYTVKLIAYNSFGCSDTLEKVNYLSTFKEGYVYAPNAFSPNNNSKNEEFKPSLYNVKQDNYIFRIYNRWGEKVYETTDLNGSWDGMHNGVPCEQDVYVWTVSGLFINNDEFALRGTVTLLK